MMLPRRNRLGAEYKTPSARTSKKSVPQMHATPHFQKPHNKGKNLLHRMNATIEAARCDHHECTNPIQTFTIPDHTTAAESFRQARG